MAEMNILEAIRTAMDEEMARDERVMVLGEDVGRKGGVFGATEGLWAKYGDKRVLDTPLTEGMIAGAEVGGGEQFDVGFSGCLGELRVGGPDAIGIGVGDVARQLRLVQLHPFHPGGTQARDEFHIGIDQRLPQAVEVIVGCVVSQGQIGERAD